MKNQDGTRNFVGIGAISTATGVPVPTLRTWERRYGFPQPVRLPSGHRRYDPAIVEQIRLISSALQNGYRASEVVGRSVSELLAMLGDVQGSAPVGVGREVERLVAQAVAGNDNVIDAGMHSAHARLGALAFVETWAGPLLIEIGRAWHNGKLSVSEEHALSERVREFLSHLWRPVSERNAGPVVVMTTLPGEQHDLGLHMAAVAVATAGTPVHFLGANTPLQDIVTVAHQSDAQAVVLSISQAAAAPTVHAAVEKLRNSLEDHVALVVGGAGWVADVDGVEAPGSLGALYERFRGLPG